MKKSLFVIIALSLLMLIGCDESNESSAFLESFDKSEANRLYVHNLTCYYPNDDWRIVFSKYNDAKVEYDPDYSSSNDDILTYEVKMYSNDTFENALQAFKSEKGIGDEDIESVTIDGCNNAIQYKEKEDKEDKCKKYGYLLQCGETNFLFEMQCFDKAYYDTKGYDAIIKAADFRNYEDPVLESISAEYTGKKSGGIMIDKKNKDIKVKCIYSDGREIYVKGWTMKNPRKTRFGKNNKYNIEYKGKKTILSIRTKMTCRQVIKRADSMAKKTLPSHDHIIRYDKEKNQYSADYDIGMELYNLMKSDDDYKAQEEWTKLRSTLTNLCDSLKTLFETNGFEKVTVFVDAYNPGREESQCMIIKNRDVLFDFYD